MYVMQGTRLIMKKARFLGNTAVSGLAGAVAVEVRTLWDLHVVIVLLHYMHKFNI